MGLYVCIIVTADDAMFNYSRLCIVDNIESICIVKVIIVVVVLGWEDGFGKTSKIDYQQHIMLLFFLKKSKRDIHSIKIILF